MNITSVIFFVIFVVPLVALLAWVMRQDKRRGVIGLIVLGILVVIGIVFMYIMTKGK